MRPRILLYAYFSRMAFFSGLSETVVIDGDYMHILQDFGGEDASYLSREDFDKLRSGEEEASLEVGLKSWCIVLSWIEAGRWSGEVYIHVQ